jgi:energy-coupling factor transporter ATP-binding protein EcfA2
MKRKRLDAQVAVKLQGGSEALFGDVGYQHQVEVVQIAAQAAYNGFNRVDQVSGFRGVVSVALSHGPGGVMVDGSSSSGLAYGLSLFLSWWKAKAKPQPALPSIIATGTLSRLGEVTPIEGMAAKLQGTLSFLEQQDDETDSVFICHPDNAQEINPVTREELNALHCDIIEATSLGDALKLLLGDWFDGDGISEPFKGLDSFEYVDQQRFFGREQDVEALINALNKSDGSLVVAGASGSGKSSLLKAGVIPAIERTEQGCVATFSTPQDIGKDIESWLNSLPDTSDERHLIIIDQAESLFRGIAGDANEWLDTLQNYLNQRPNTQLIISIRDEFIAALSKHSAFSEMQLFTVPAELSHQQWYTIITKQAEYANLSFEEGLVDELMTVAMERRDNLPLMSFLLQQMHAHSDKLTRSITFKDYDAVGKLEGVIDTQAEKAIRNFDEDTLKQWLPILFQHLIWVNEDDSTTLSRPYEITEQTPQNINVLIQVLYEEKLLKRISKDKPIYQIAHERLMTSWKRIEDWLKEDKAFLLWRQKVTKQAKEWDENNRPKELLLAKGLPINEARKWKDERLFELNYFGELINEYVHSSSLQVKRQSQKITAYILTVIFCLTAAMLYAQTQYHEAVKNKEIAENKVREANAQRDAFYTAQSRFLAAQSFDAASRGEFDTAAILALHAIPGPYGDPSTNHSRPSIPEAMAAYSYSVDILERVRFFSGKGKAVTLSHSGNLALVREENGELLVWDIYENEIIKRLDFNARGKVIKAQFSSNNESVAILYGFSEVKVYVFSINTGKGELKWAGGGNHSIMM